MPCPLLYSARDTHIATLTSSSATNPLMRPRPSSPPEELPDGFVYHPGFLTEDEHAELLHIFESLPFQPYDYRGYEAKRRIVRYGVAYDFGTQHPNPVPPIPEFLIPIRERAAALAGLPTHAIVQAMVAEYSPGSPIGWHRDAPQFGTVIGISLASSARMRFKPYSGPGKIVSQIVEPRSLYVISGPARSEFKHSIPAVEELRYSITFRTLRESRRKQSAA
jgi:alkylated DNA repair dioxygenase AlkB